MMLIEQINYYWDRQKYHGHLGGNTVMEMLEELKVLSSDAETALEDYYRVDEIPDYYYDSDEVDDIRNTYDKEITSLENIICNLLDTDELCKPINGYTRKLVKKAREKLNG